MTMTKQDILDKERDDKIRAGLTSYVPEHLIAPHLRKRHGSFEYFEQAMDESVFTDHDAQVADINDYPDGEIESSEGTTWAGDIPKGLYRRNRSHIEY